VDPVAKKVIGQVANRKRALMSGGIRRRQTWPLWPNYGDQTPGSSLSVIDLEAAKNFAGSISGPCAGRMESPKAKAKIYFTAEASKVVARYEPGHRPA